MKTELKDFGNLPDKETYIGLAFMYFDSNFEKEKALWYAYQSKQYSDVKESKFRLEGEEVLKLYNKGMAYIIISFIYLWNDWFEEAYELESAFMNSGYWNEFNDLIERYIELLIVKGQNERVYKLFSDEDFRNCFPTHFEVFINITSDKNNEEPKSDDYKALVAKLNDLYDKYAEVK